MLAERGFIELIVISLLLIEGGVAEASSFSIPGCHWGFILRHMWITISRRSP